MPSRAQQVCRSCTFHQHHQSSGVARASAGRGASSSVVSGASEDAWGHCKSQPAAGGRIRAFGCHLPARNFFAHAQRSVAELTRLSRRWAAQRRVCHRVGAMEDAPSDGALALAPSVRFFPFAVQSRCLDGLRCAILARWLFNVSMNSSERVLVVPSACISAFLRCSLSGRGPNIGQGVFAFDLYARWRDSGVRGRYPSAIRAGSFQQGKEGKCEQTRVHQQALTAPVAAACALHLDAHLLTCLFNNCLMDGSTRDDSYQLLTRALL